MSFRWKVLLAIGLSVAIVDQWTKFLAVKHLTPGFVTAHAASGAPVDPAAQDAVLAEMGLGTQLAYFYGTVKGPCRSQSAVCPTVRVIDGFWNWRYVENPGAAWGLLSNASENLRIPFFFVVSIGALVFIISFFRRLDDGQRLLIVALSLVFGGAIGNFIDRLHLSYVIDFIDWYVGTAHWPTFNFADSAISVGVGLLVLEWIRDWLRSRAQGASAVKDGSARPSTR